MRHVSQHTNQHFHHTTVHKFLRGEEKSVLPYQHCVCSLVPLLREIKVKAPLKQWENTRMNRFFRLASDKKLGTRLGYLYIGLMALCFHKGEFQPPLLPTESLINRISGHCNGPRSLNATF